MRARMNSTAGAARVLPVSPCALAWRSPSALMPSASTKRR
jgi:hypothetical protein